MMHEMNLYPEPFSKIDCGKKKYELRLLDEKRSKLKLGDTINFTNTVNGMRLKTIVKSILKYKDTQDLLNHIDKTLLGFSGDEVIDSNFMEDFYGKDKVERYGVVAIGIESLGHSYKDCQEFRDCNKLTEEFFGKDDESWFKGHLKIAKTGYHLAECQVGWAYLSGTGVEKDMDKAKYWLELSSQHGDPDAINNLELLNNQTLL